MPKQGNVPGHRRRRLAFERLEPRNLLAVSSSLDALGALQIESDAGDPITVGVSNGQVEVNGADPGSGPLSASLVSSVRIEAGPEGSRIDLGEVVPAAFPALRTVEVDGESGVDTLTGPQINADWSFFGTDSGQILNSDTGSWPIYSFSGIEDIKGSGLADHFVFSDGATLSGSIDGGGGSDSLDFLDFSSDLSASLEGSDPSGFSGQMTGIGGGFQGIDSIVGGGGTNRLVGEDADSTWTLSSTSTYRQGSDTLSFWGFTVLQGGAGSDRFELQGDSLGNLSAQINGGPGDDVFDFENVVYLTGGLDGGAGLDTLSYADFETSVVVNLTGSDANGYQGTEPLSFGGGGFSGIDSVEASPPSAGPSTLIGEDTEATWTVSDQGSYTDASARPLLFSGFEALQGGSAADTFQVSASSTPWTIDGGAPDTPPGDLLVLDARGRQVDQGPTVLSPQGFAKITYSGIETVQIENQPTNPPGPPPPPVTPPKVADVSLGQILSSTSMTVGQTLTITLTVRNLGPDPASGVKVSDSLPPGAKLLSSSPSPDDLGSDGRTPTFALGLLDPGESRTITLSVRLDSAGQFSNRVSAQSENDPDPSNNSASGSFQVLAPPVGPPFVPVEPRIASIQRIGLLPRFTRFVVTYQNVIDWRSVATPEAFTLVAPGQDWRFGTCDDRRIHLRLVSFNPWSNSVTFQPVVQIPVRLPVLMVVAHAGADMVSAPMLGHRLHRPFR